MIKNLYLISFLFSGTLLAQSNTVGTSSGVSNTNGSLNVTVGQVSYVAVSNASGSVNSGNQQPYEIFVNGVNQLQGLSLSFAVYPNPTSDFLNLKLENKPVENLFYQVTDATGKLLFGKTISTKITLVDMKELASGTYMLHVYQSEKQVNSYKILKK